MAICKNCGVELEEDMKHCPLCGEAVFGDSGNNQNNGTVPDAAHTAAPREHPETQYRGEMSGPEKKLTWEVVSLILLSGSIATFIIDFIINNGITWSEYPAAVSLTIFAYISMFAFWRRAFLLQMAGGLALSVFFLLALDMLTRGFSWSAGLGIPLLLSVNFIVLLLAGIIRRSRSKGINLLAWGFLGAAVLCLCIEGILARFRTGALHLDWSIIVTGCVIPVVVVLFFVHLRLKKGRSLKKTFHI